MKKLVSIYYFNDRRVEAYVCVGTLHGGIKLKPGQGKVFDVLVDDKDIPYIKTWDNNIVLISTIPAKIVEKRGD